MCCGPGQRKTYSSLVAEDSVAIHNACSVRTSSSKGPVGTNKELANFGERQRIVGAKLRSGRVWAERCHVARLSRHAQGAQGRVLRVFANPQYCHYNAIHWSRSSCRITSNLCCGLPVQYFSSTYRERYLHRPELQQLVEISDIGDNLHRDTICTGDFGNRLHDYKNIYERLCGDLRHETPG